MADGHAQAVAIPHARLRGALEQLIPNHDHLFDSVRGVGLMLGLKLSSDSRAFVAHLRDNHGLLTVAAGDNVVRVLPPLNIEQQPYRRIYREIVSGRGELHAARSVRIPFVSSEVETPLGSARHHGISTSLDANGGCLCPIS